MIRPLLRERKRLEDKIKAIDDLYRYIESKTDFTDRERGIIDKTVEEKRTLESVAAEYGVRRERIRKVQSKALERMANCKAWSHKKTRELMRRVEIFDSEEETK